ncbi:hypothetical protein NDU88_001094 [Pleurodeles waltl]|uniref:Uncharacterized protein n=1 Tax=Pleurodeles waltl TaxID=8319 RepID=A0AAV7WHD1_PLEWA|nr:hypothetical protein NDU88_001094 [Pleurodeles waltl]
MAHLHILGVHVFPYRDDWLIVASSFSKAGKYALRVGEVLKSLVFLFNVSLRQLDRKRKKIIGAVFDTKVARVFLPQDRMLSLQHQL